MSLDKERRAAYQKAYYEANREKVAAQQKAYREANREKVAAYHRAYREANREKLAAYQKAYCEANREKVAAYREANREKITAYQKAYREANREKLAAYYKAYLKANREKAGAKEKGMLLKSARKEHGYTQRELADLCGITRQTVSLTETGRLPVRPELFDKVFYGFGAMLSRETCGTDADRPDKPLEDVKMRYFMPEPSTEPEEEKPAVIADCGCEVWHGEYTVEWEGKMLCPDCFRAAIERMLEHCPTQLAEELNLEVEEYV